MKSVTVSTIGDVITDAPKPSVLDYSISQHACGHIIDLYSPHGLCYRGFHSQPEAALQEYRRYIPYDIGLGDQIDTRETCFHLIGTDFQVMVWQCLCKVSYQDPLNYSQFAELCQRPTAVRAIASAIARNPIAIAIPCHRIVPKSGGSGQYRWGQSLKKQLLRIESHQF